MSESSDLTEAPCCDKCGLEITTGFMVFFCPEREQCEFWDDDLSPDAKKFVRDLWKKGWEAAEQAQEGKHDRP
jgi:hypothetical protein